MASPSWLAFTKWVDTRVNGQSVGQFGRWVGSLLEQLLEHGDTADTFKGLAGHVAMNQMSLLQLLTF